MRSSAQATGEMRGAIADALYLDTYAPRPPAALMDEPAPFQGSGDPTR